MKDSQNGVKKKGNSSRGEGTYVWDSPREATVARHEQALQSIEHANGGGKRTFKALDTSHDFRDSSLFIRRDTF